MLKFTVLKICVQLFHSLRYKLQELGYNKLHPAQCFALQSLNHNETILSGNGSDILDYKPS
jgi:hypothetical protein